MEAMDICRLRSRFESHPDERKASLVSDGCPASIDCSVSEGGAQHALIGHLGVDFQAAQRRLRRFTVDIIPAGAEVASGHLTLLEQLIREWGMPCETGGQLAVVPAESYLSPDCHATVTRLLGQKRSVLVCRPLAAEAWVGPLIQPGGLCWACVKRCIALQHPHLIYLYEHASDSNDVPAPPPSFSEASRALAYGYIAGCLAQHAVRDLRTRPRGHDVENHIVSLEAASGKQNVHYIARRFNCTACRAARAPEDVVALRVNAGDLKHPLDGSGQDRTAALEHAYERVQPLISPVAGVISTLETHSLLNV